MCYTEGVIYLFQTFCLFDLEIHVVTLHSPKVTVPQFWDSVTNAPRVAKLCDVGKSEQLLHYSKLVTSFHMQLFKNKISLCC